MSFRLLVAAAAARRMGDSAIKPQRHAAFTSQRSFSFTAPRRHGGQTLVEKIAQRCAAAISLGIRPRHIMTHDNTGAVIPKLADARQPVFALDHDIQNKGEKNLAKYSGIEKFAKQHGNRFYPAGRGIAHQVLGTMVVGSDSHSNMYGGIGCLGSPVELRGQLPPGVVGKDVIVALCGLFGKDEVLNHAVEDRLAIANMTTEWGALAGVFAVDEITLQWYEQRAAWIKKQIGDHPNVNDKTVGELRASADADASYAKHLWLDLSSLTPHVSGPDSVKVASPLSALEKDNIKINKAYIVSCVNSRAKDLKEAADVVRAIQQANPGKQVRAPEGVAWYVAAASTQVLADAQASGDWQVLVDAGARTLPPGCGPCIGLGVGLLEDGEVGISATNRNYKGRMGSKKAHTYLASPAVVAASAIAGRICSPQSAICGAPGSSPSPGQVSFGIEAAVKKPAAAAAKSSGAIAGFPTRLVGRLVFLPADNLNTDGIYPGKYTYQDDITREQMKAIVMENYDPEFARLIQADDVVVAGANFGTGSSREQAATALLAAGVRLVVCESASETFKRNAVNNGLLVLECPPLVQWLRSKYQADGCPLTVVSGLEAHVELTAGQMQLVDAHGAQVLQVDMPKIGKAAQEIIVAGGLENWVRNRMAAGP
ncbi:aconitase iron-sulfur domain-containing protein [Linderina pennispora]|uniref:Aconitase iron-sulfur domain-containing protein n=1 Tax=Linderina pennispora TaxID=61395 RepID=A0A1Y1WLK3_9FUNG|nr:aconitase iron-sulfur domain-containing protein [Linderina pennispora]ORX74178.1 aconitase iron-sulfur domain-containing protein [Linderina pennispora]